MASPDSSPQDDSNFVGTIEPVEDRRRRFAILSRDDSLKGTAILFAVGVVLLLAAAYGLGRETGFIDKLINVALRSTIALPIDLIGLFIAGSVLGTGFGSFRSAVVRLAAIIVLLQGLCWILFLSYVSTESIYVLAGGGLLVCLLSVGLMMECFDLLIFETIVCLVILGATESAAAALVKWLLVSEVIHLGGSSDPITALSLLLAQQLPF